MLYTMLYCDICFQYLLVQGIMVEEFGRDLEIGVIKQILESVSHYVYKIYDAFFIS